MRQNCCKLVARPTAQNSRRLFADELPVRNIGKEEHTDFDFLGRHVHQNDDFSIEVDQHSYVKTVKPIHIPRERRNKPDDLVTPKELHEYRSLVGQLAWPALIRKLDRLDNSYRD